MRSNLVKEYGGLHWRLVGAIYCLLEALGFAKVGYRSAEHGI